MLSVESAVAAAAPAFLRKVTGSDTIVVGGKHLELSSSFRMREGGLHLFAVETCVL